MSKETIPQEVNRTILQYLRRLGTIVSALNTCAERIESYNVFSKVIDECAEISMARYTGYIISELDSLARLLDIPGLIVAGSRVQVALDKASQKEEQGEPYYLLWTVTEERVERWKQTPIDYDDLLTALSAKEIKRAKNGDRYHIYLKTSIKPKYLYGGLEILTKENVKNLNLLEDF